MSQNALYDRSLSAIAISVILAHAALGAWLAWTGVTSPIPMRPRQRVAVQTISLNESKPVAELSKSHIPEPLLEQPKIAAAEPVSEEAKPMNEAPKPIEEPIKKEETLPGPIPQPPKPKAKTEPLRKESKKETLKKEPDKTPKKTSIKKADPVVAKKKEMPKPDPNLIKKKELLTKAQERIAKIQTTSDKISTGNDPKRSEKNFITLNEGGGGERENSYREEIASRLKLQLSLPEYGEVKIKLTLNRLGRVEKVTIVSSESSMNREFVEKMLPAMMFPAFGTNFEKAQTYTFTITLGNNL